MELDDSWYSSQQIYSISYRPLRPGSNLMVETIRFNPSACTCGKQCSEPHYRMESRVINKAARVDIRDLMKNDNEKNTRKMKSDDEFVNDKASKVDINGVLSEIKNSIKKSGDDSHTTTNEMEQRSAITESLTSVDVKGDGNREASIESRDSIKSDVEDIDVKIIDMKFADEVVEIEDSVKYDIEEFKNDVKFEAKCEFVNKSCVEDRDVKVIDIKGVDEVVVIGDSVKGDVEVGEFRNNMKFETECEFVNANKTNSIDDITGNDASVKNGSECGYSDVSSNGKSPDDVTGTNSSVNNVLEGGHVDVSYVEISDHVTENDNIVKNGTEVGEVGVSKMDYHNDVTEATFGIKQDSDKCEVVSPSRKDNAVYIASRSCMDRNDDHDIDVEDDFTVSGEILRDKSSAGGRCLDVDIEEIVHEDTTEFVEEISASFGIMSVYCNSELHCSR